MTGHTNIIIISDYHLESKCVGWGGHGTVIICNKFAIKGDRDGFLEEFLLHESAHIVYDSLLRHTKEWNCARDSDKSYISLYAKRNPNR